MITEENSRTANLIGEAAIERLHGTRVAIFGIGGVGGAVAEALCRAGVGALDLIDADRVSLSNINRQNFALHSTVGELKVDAAKARLLDIDPAVTLRTYPVFYLPETAGDFDFSVYDYVVDAVDTVAAKISIVEEATRAGVPVISAMGAGNKLDPTAFRVADIAKTSVCPLARVMRTELRKRGIMHLDVVYSEEPPRKPRNGERTPASISFVPPAMGFAIASRVVRALCGV